MSSKYLIILSLIMVVSSCMNRADTTRKLILEVEGHYLYQDELDKVIPKHSSKVDSGQLATRYIRKWATDVLVYENANRNLRNSEKIDQMVEEYRKSLIIHKYEQGLVEQRFSQKIPEKSIEIFYQKYGNQLRLKENLIKGVLLVVPKSTVNIGKVGSWVRYTDKKSIEKIEKFSIRNAILYRYFLDDWLPFSEIENQVPISTNSVASFIRTTNFYQTSDSTQTYFLRITNRLYKGDKSPLEMARKNITKTLLNKKRTEFILQFEREIYQDAVNNGTLKWHISH